MPRADERAVRSESVSSGFGFPLSGLAVELTEVESLEFVEQRGIEHCFFAS
jgi:hypothetical protein